MRLMAGDPEKWEPATRETADHSMPFLVAAAISAVNFVTCDDGSSPPSTPNAKPTDLRPTGRMWS